jgi:hypothetical protein
MGGIEQLNEKETCTKERVKITMRASDAMATHGTRTQERASTRLAVCQKDDRMKS